MPASVVLLVAKDDLVVALLRRHLSLALPDAALLLGEPLRLLRPQRLQLLRLELFGAIFLPLFENTDPILDKNGKDTQKEYR